MRLFDAVAGSIKSGGKTRRAAKMVILDSDHPDIEEFINSKVLGEDVAQALIAAGFDGDFSAKGGAYEYAPFQNANHSVRLNAAFMQAVEQDDDWHLVNRTDGKVAKTLKARSLMDQIANAAWRSADPGVQFDDVVNHWNPVLDVQRINASNPCSEYMFVDDSACNLASINFMRLRDKDGNVDAELLRHVTTLLITAMEAVVSNASYPNQLIEKNSHDFRPLGLGYGNMGALLMSLGLGYDTAAARRYAGYLSSLICSQAYLTSAQLAERVGPFARFPETPGSFTRVMRQHLQAAEAIPADFDDRPDIANWQKVVEACASGRGVRNAQVTVIAPTGTISFLMGFDTTGIEPPFALQTFKKFIDGSIKQLTIDCARQALEQIQPQPSVGVVETNETLRQWREGLWEWINEHGTPEGYLRFRAQDLSIFDCAVNSGEGTRYLSPLAHVQMMAAVQPFISGAISKTVNLPTEISVDEVYDMHLVAWKQGLKSLAMYRNGSKGSAPLRTTVDEDQKQLSKPAAVTSTNGLAPPVGEPVRHRLPETAAATRHKFSISGYEGYIHVGEFASKHPGEVFVTMSKAGSTINGLMDSLATMISLLLQYGVPLEKISEKMRHQSFTPQGITGNPDIHFATSPVDYLAQYLTLHYDGEKQIHGSKPLQDSLDGVTFDNVPTVAQAAAAVRVQEMGTKQTEMQFPIALLAKVGSGAETGEICGECGNTMRFVGTCYICPHCGNNSGCS
jgi:ribonucleoside-diphosphate reductase alpha chain